MQPYSFVTTSDLIRFVDALALRAGDTLVDLGCGQGGVGLWIARRTRTDLIGVDLSPTAIARARQRIAAFDLAGQARFETGDLRRTGLAAQSCHGAVSVDVLWTPPDQGAAMAETARILAERVLHDAEEDPIARTDLAFRRVLSRPLKPDEKEVVESAIDRIRHRFEADPDSARELIEFGERPVDETLDMIEYATYTALCNAVLNLDEAVTKE